MFRVEAATPERLVQNRNLLERQKERSFFTWMALAIALTVFAGFVPTYFLKGLFATPALSLLLHVHGAVFTGWILLFLLQVRLVASSRITWHRRLGVVGAVLAAAMLVVGMAAAIDSASRGFSPPGGPPPLVFFAIPVFDLVVFGTLVGLALALRKRPAAHKRLMLLATIVLLTPAIARLPVISGSGPLAFFLLANAFIFVCILRDRLAQGRVHPAFLWGGLFMIASQPLRLAIGTTDSWLAFAGWITS